MVRDQSSLAGVLLESIDAKLEALAMARDTGPQESL
jgi:hypothetical protein